MMNRIVVFAIALISFQGFSQITVSFDADTVCLGTASQLTSTSTTSVGAIIGENWDLNGNGQFTNASGNSISFQFASADTFNVGLQVINDQGDTATMYQSVVVLYQPTASFMPSEVCIGNSTAFFNSSNSYTGDTLTYSWDFGDTFSSSDMAPQHMYADSGMYNATLTVTSLTGCMDMISQTVTVNGLPTIEITASDTMICRGVSPVTLSHTTNASLSFWQSGESSPSIMVFDTGWYYVVATDTNTCINRDSIEIKAYTIPIMTVSPDTFVVIGNSVTLEASGMSTYTWTPTESLDNATSSNPEASPTESTVYQVVGLSADGCADTGRVTVEVREDYSIEYSNIMTPNGDNINDQFVIGNLGSFDGCNFSVFNKWGDEVYSSTNYQNDWDGSYNGSALPEDSYYFVMECPVSENSFTGTINILR